ncbi:NAD(P)-binding protein [Guyanagaster necrorhizus]|uniref:NAD(P)-binding protein n=1 Tax=Guyanagaster necrorhizus TaxID=856835 RepID=A0A9P8AS95_9AGAR|nr:NAD(P)-binding protein [Guyanagaster necrorhizus MCA 3950]KAG7444637.1 NAD(P)-binding protein [Guyanagaster necrorhizus MCA 3950]
MSSTSSSTSTRKLIFVTGGTGFIGFHILTQLLDKGYHVRAAARGRKISLLKKALSANYSSDNFEVVEVRDVCFGDFSLILKGIDGIIHAAAPLPGRVSAEIALRTAIEGSLHILREAVRAKVPRAVVTSAVLSYDYPKGPYGADSWNPITKEEAIAFGLPSLIYAAQKKYSDLAVVEFSYIHPEIDVTLVGPPFNYGPFARGFEHLLPEPDLDSLSTNATIYSFLRPDTTAFPIVPGAIDVRDTARAHVLALESPLSPYVGRKRVAIVCPHECSYKAAIEIIARERPELKDRLADVRRAPEWSCNTLPLDWKRISEVIGMNRDSFFPWEKTVLDAVDSLLRIENLWKEKGFDLKKVKGFIR